MGAEEPFLVVTADEVPWHESWHTSYARRVLQSDRRTELFAQLRSWYPAELNDLPLGVRDEAQKTHAATVLKLVAKAAAPEVTEEVALILLLKMQFNALQDGLFATLYLMNHANYPNCVLLGPGDRPAACARKVSGKG